MGTRLTAVSLTALISLSLAACGGDDREEARTSGVEPSGTAAATATSTVITTANDQLPVRPQGDERRVVVDTDLAVDDLIALAFLLSSPDVDVVAVTVSGTGEVRCPEGLDVIRGLLAVTRDDGLPVACGRSTPLEGRHAFPTEWRDMADDAYGLDLARVPGAGREPTAVELLLDATEPGGVTLLTLGPLTNVAEAIRVDPALTASGRISSIVAMGGAVDVGGNVFGQGADPPTAEWNLYVDPVAAAEVLSSGVPIVLVGLDATNHVPITLDVLRTLAANAHSEPARLVRTLLAGNPQVATGEAYFWDPLAAAAVVEPDLLTTEVASIEVVTGEGADSGRTVRSATGREVTLAVGADEVAFETLLVRTLDRLDEGEPLVEPPPLVGEATVRDDGVACTYAGPSTVGAGTMRVAFEASDRAMGLGLAHLTGELTIEEVVDWVAANPASAERPPGIASVSVVAAGAVADVELAPGTHAVVCASDLSVPGGIHVAGSILVE